MNSQIKNLKRQNNSGWSNPLFNKEMNNSGLILIYMASCAITTFGQVAPDRFAGTSAQVRTDLTHGPPDPPAKLVQRLAFLLIDLVLNVPP